MENKIKYGLTLVILPVFMWLIIGLANGFSFAHPWAGSVVTDWFLGSIGLAAIIIGILLIVGSYANAEDSD